LYQFKPFKSQLNFFYERRSGAFKMQENLLAAGALLRTPLGELTALPQTQ